MKIQQKICAKCKYSVNRSTGNAEEPHNLYFDDWDVIETLLKNK